MTRRYLWVFIGALSLGLGCPTERKEDVPDSSGATIIQIDEGPLRGASMKVPYGAYTGTEPLTMAAGAAIPLDGMGEPGDAVTAVGPAMELGPDGTQFAEPMTISLPFSSQAYNDGDMEDTQIAVVGRHAGGSVIGFDIGPVGLESIGFDIGPVGFDIGPVGIVANEGNELNDALLVFQVTEFSSYQVVRVSKSDWVCDRWEHVSAGDHHTCGLFDIGTKTELYCWGDNASLTLGNNHEEKGQRNAPKVAVEENDNKDWRSVAVGGSHTCAIDSEKDLYCWGSDSHGQLGSGTVTTWGWVHPNHVGKTQELRFKSVSLGWYHTCAIDKDKQLWCWGGNDHGQLGIGYVGAQYNTGNPIPLQVGSVPLEWVSVEAGAEHTCATTKEDALYCWGHNNKGQVDSAEETIGLGKPQRMGTASADRFKSVTTGLEHTCAITSGKCDDVTDPCDPEGTLYCWGENGWGQLGINEEEGQWPMTKVRGEQQWRKVAAGSYHTCALGDGEDNKGLWCWGNNGSGQLLADDPNLAKAIQPVSVVQQTQWVQFSMGRDHSCGLVGDGKGSRLFCAGSNANGQLGDLEADDPSHKLIGICLREDSDLTGSDGPCVPDCENSVCGDDGCGGSCGECPDTSYECSEGVCELTCIDDEGNNSYLTAVPLSNELVYTGGFCVESESGVDGNHVSEDDWYQFELTTAGTFGITVLQASLDETVLIEVYEAAEFDVSGEVDPFPIETSLGMDLTQPGTVYTGTGEAGVYYVRLRLEEPSEKLPDDWYYSIQVNLICGDTNTNLSPETAVGLFVGVEAEQTFCPWVPGTYRWFTIELPPEKQCQFEILYAKGAALKALLYDASILTNPNATPLDDLSSGVSLDPTLESLFLSLDTCGLGKKFLRVEAKDPGSQPLDNWVYTITATYTD